MRPTEKLKSESNQNAYYVPNISCSVQIKTGIGPREEILATVSNLLSCSSWS